MSSWWEKKLGGNQPPPPPPARPSPYANVLPYGMGQNQDQVVQHYMDRNQIPQQQEEQPVFVQVGPNEVAVPPPPSDQLMTLDGDPHNYHRRMWGWRGDATKGGARETQVTGNCPECGSPRFFSRSSEAKTNSNTGQMCLPAPECFECGYPRNQGTLATSGQVIKRLPGASNARQPSAAELIAPDHSLATLNKAGFRQPGQ